LRTRRLKRALANEHQWVALFFSDKHLTLHCNIEKVSSRVVPDYFWRQKSANLHSDSHLRLGALCLKRDDLTRRILMQLSDKHREYWSKNLRLTAVLLAIWFLVTFVIGYYARELNFNFFGWPFAFYMGAQGSLIIYCVIIWYYARTMNRLDEEYGVAEGEE
jgi:putative solute:sodium symporter small subunit